ncbi:macrolide 2'-phosphotransferase [Arthrobacter sp. JSM 101049]|uniref:macrolide 2'-phosphotransferase n=1 Tax=Arthrobacter sp. JSM 101049 TaxID=929097 RepID=UPI0035668DDE
MSTDSPDADMPAVVELAARHGLELATEGITFNEAGLDYRVAFAHEDGDPGKQWVLRIPRRDDVSAKLDEERAILDFVRPRLSVAVPHWRIHAPELIAYPLLPGFPGLTLDDDGEPVWHVDTSSPAYAESLARVIAALHTLDPDAAEAAGVPSESPAGVREKWRADLERVRAEFEVSEDLLGGWRAWLADDGLWPTETVFTHGELYPAHLLLDEHEDVVSVLDWTTAKVGDPAIDFAFHCMSSSADAFERTVAVYTELTGRTEPRLAERCGALLSAGPLSYGLFALATGEPDHRAAAAAMLNPDPSGE